MAHHYVFLGPPGSGKGTQAQALAQALDLPHISTGDIFRDHIARATALGQKIEALLKQGQLVPDEITKAVIAERLQADDAQAGFVLDGYPRNINQAEFLSSLSPAARAILIDLPDDEAVKRIAGRRTCVSCGAVYHVDYKPLQQAGICDLCGGDVRQRNDETEEVVRDRLIIYHQQIEPVLVYYRQRSLLTTIDGEPPIAKVTAAIRLALKL